MKTAREEVEKAIMIEMAWLKRAVEEILRGELSQELKKYIALAVAPWRNSGTRMNMPEYRKAVRLRKILFGVRQKKRLPKWIFEFSNEKTESIDLRIAEQFRAHLGKKLLRFAR